MGAPVLTSKPAGRRSALGYAALLVALAGCVDSATGPSQFGEVRVEPAYRTGFEPAAIDVTLDTASVVVVRSGTGDQVLESRNPYSGGPLAWVVDLASDEESLTVAVRLWSGGTVQYAGDTSVVVESGDVGAGQSHDLAVVYVGPPVVSSITVSPATDTLVELGAKEQFTAAASDPGGDVVQGASFAWSSSNTAVATIDVATGLATAAGNGTTTITATSGSAQSSATLTVNLVDDVATVTVTPGSATLTAVGATQQFTGEARDAGGVVLPGVPVTWASASQAVATVDPATGLATATGHGATTITATSGSVRGSASLAVNLTARVASLTVSPVAATLTLLGATQQFTAEARDAAGTVLPGVPVDWSTSDGAVAAIDAATGLATATGNGATTVTAASGPVRGIAALIVNLAAGVASMTVSPGTATLTEVGATQQFTAEARDAAGTVLPGVPVIWTTSDAAVAAINPATGLATATGHGGATITATSGSVRGTATITVSLTASVASVTVNPGSPTLTAVGATQQFTAEVRDGAGTVLPGVPVSWTTSDGAVANIDPATGLAIATGNGSTTITATSGSVRGTATLTVNLTASVASLTVSPSSATLTAVGGTQQFTAEARDAAGTVLPGVPVSWTTSDGAVGTIDPITGLATATGHGATTITATSGSIRGTATLTVNLTASVASLTVSPSSATLTAVGATQQFTAEARDAAGSVLPGVPVTWSSSGQTVATIDPATGLATATGDGAVTITAAAGAAAGTAQLTVHQEIVRIVVSPDSARVEARDPPLQQQFTAQALDANGNVIAGVAFVWASSDTAVATVDSTGLATAMAPGTTSITAAAGGTKGSATLTVCSPRR
jgi:uncharacterized protein YjdB